jgi:hypothetical protein
MGDAAAHLLHPRRGAAITANIAKRRGTRLARSFGGRVMIQMAAKPLMALLLMAGGPAVAQTAAVVRLSCDGKVEIRPSGEAREARSERVSNLSVVINFADHTVVSSFTSLIAYVAHLDDEWVGFIGGLKDGSSDIAYSINRMKGSATVYASQYSKDPTNKISGTKIVETQSYDLVCKVASRLF